MSFKVDVVFPCAGSAERFGNVFKPFLKIGDTTFIEKASEPFQKWQHLIESYRFIITRQQERDHNVTHRLESLFKDKKIVVSILEKETAGPLQTFYEGYVKAAESETPFIVCDCDHSIDVDSLFEKIMSHPTADIIIPTWDITEAIQHNWSKILLQESRIIKFVNKEAVDFKTYIVKGIIGCIYFNSLSLFSESQDSLCNFYEIISDHFNRGKKIILSDARNAYFYGDPIMLEDCIEKRRNECTIFCDIDGVLVKHHNHSTTDVENNSVLKGFTKLRKLGAENHRIILTTARNEKYRQEVENLMQKKGIHYDDLIMSLPTGPRILINDRKPSKIFTPQATALETERDSGLKNLNVSAVIANNNIRVLKDLSANSFAKTYLIQQDGVQFVRKHILKSVGAKHYEILKRQKTDLERLNFLVEGVCPKIIKECDSDIEYYYDMEYLPEHQMLSEADEQTQKSKLLINILQILNKNVYSLSKPVDGLIWVHNFLSQKINPKFDNFNLLRDEFRLIIESEEFFINGKKYIGLRKLFDLLPYEELSPSSISVVHGDLTLENIMYNPRTLDIKLIDMDGSRLFDARELDLGKLSQSIFSNYNSWKNKTGDELIFDINVANKSFVVEDAYFKSPAGDLSSTLIELWQEIIEESQEITLKKAYFYMSTYFIRFMPFRLQRGLKHGIFALLMATVWLNKILLGEENKDEYQSIL